MAIIQRPLPCKAGCAETSVSHPSPVSLPSANTFGPRCHLSEDDDDDAARARVHACVQANNRTKNTFVCALTHLHLPNPFSVISCVCRRFFFHQKASQWSLCFFSGDKKICFFKNTHNCKVYMHNTCWLHQILREVDGWVILFCQCHFQYMRCSLSIFEISCIYFVLSIYLLEY